MSDNFIAQLFLFPFFLVFIRLGAAIMIFPGLSDPSISPRIRILLALTASLVLFPAVYAKMPPLPSQASQLVFLVVVEVMIGLLMAMGARLFIGVMNVAGDVMSFMSGFQAATLFDPRSGSASTAPAAFLIMIATVLVFALDFHHVMIKAVIGSYDVLPPGALPQAADSAAAVVRLIGNMYVVGLKIAAPVMVIGFLTYAGFGILNRMVPSVQAFFIALPLTITLALFALGVTLGSMLTLYAEEMAAHAIILFQED
jgi:flagellar biosynthetic protein FliR